MPRSFVRDLLEWFGFPGQGTQEPEPPQIPVEPVYFSDVPVRHARARMIASLPPAYLAWLHEPIQWFEDWKRRVRTRTAIAKAFDHDADFMELLELFA